MDENIDTVKFLNSNADIVFQQAFDSEVTAAHWRNYLEISLLVGDSDGSVHLVSLVNAKKIQKKKLEGLSTIIANEPRKCVVGIRSDPNSDCYILIAYAHSMLSTRVI